VSAYQNGGDDHFFEDFRGTASRGLARDSDAERALGGRLRVARGPLFLDAAVNTRLKEIPTATYGTVFDPAHSDVTQPSPLPFLNPGTPASTLAVQWTRVPPIRIRQDPSA
jgi:hypothetical protein